MNRYEEMLTFVQVVRAESLTGAARRLDVAVSAVSRRLSLLEQRLQAPLLNRSTRQLTLTETGRSFYHQCEQILADIDAAESQVRQEQHHLSGLLRITAPSTLTNRHLNQAVTAFMQQNPDLRIELDMDDRQVDLLNEGYDLAIRIGQLQDSSLIARRITSISHIVCAAPAFFEHYPIPKQAQDIRDWPALCYGNLRQPELWPYQFTGANGNEQDTVKVNSRFTANSGEIILDAAIEGLGITCEPSFIVHEAIQNGQLIPVLTEYQWYNMGIYFAYPRRQHRPARVKAFTDFLLQHFGDIPYWEQQVRGL